MKTLRGRATRFGFSLVLGVLPWLAACAGGDDGGDGAPGGGEASEVYEIRAGTLAFPSMVSPIPAIIEAQGLDEEHDFELKPVPFSDIGAYYAALVSGQVDVIAGGPDIAQRLYLEGQDIKIIGSFTNLSGMVVLSRDPGIRSLTDLEGASLAATVGSSQFQILSILLEDEGIDILEDVDVVDAEPPLAIAQLARGRVDTALVWGPNVAVALEGHPEYRIIVEGRDEWKELTGAEGFELVLMMRNDLITTQADAAERWISAVEDAVAFIESDPEGAALIVEEATGLKPALFHEGLETERITYDVRPVSDAGVTEGLREMFGRSVDAGFNPEVPPDDIFYLEG